MRQRLGRLSFIVLIIFWFSPSLAFDSSEIIEHRQSEMKFAQTLVEDINAKLSVKNFAGAVTAVQNLENWSRNLRRLFPEGSEASVQNLSSASANIWESPKAFERAIKIAESMAVELLHALSEGQLEQAETIVNKLPMTCVACHQRFRN